MLAAHSDTSSSLHVTTPVTESVLPSALMENNVGYIWMFINCFASAAYVGSVHRLQLHSLTVRQVLAMRKRIKVTGFSDWDSMFYNNLLCIPILALCSFILEDWGTENLNRNL